MTERLTEAVLEGRWLEVLMRDDVTAVFFETYAGPTDRASLKRATEAAGLALDDVDITVLMHRLEARSTRSGTPAAGTESAALDVLLQDERTARFFEGYRGILTESQVARTAELAGVHLEKRDVPVLVRGLEALHTFRARLPRPS